ncbi:MAG TPA: hypothetical protein EYP56_18345 [Planctomycetaceae bacterium]|nr:hypothetical protein [Planctomycetaceae bacterium]
MNLPRFHEWLDSLTGTQVVVGLLWLGLAVLTLGLLAMLRTRWGQSHRLRKCIILSLVAHLVFVGYATTVRIVTSAPLPPVEPVRVVIAEQPWEVEPLEPTSADEPAPWDRFARPLELAPEPLQVARAQPATSPLSRRADRPKTASLPTDPPLEPVTPSGPQAPQPEMLQPEPLAAAPPARPTPEPIDVPAAQRQEGPQPNEFRPPRLERITEPDPLELAPGPAKKPGQPRSLVSLPAPPPRIREAAIGPEPEDALPGLVDQLSPAAPGTPVDLSAGPEAEPETLPKAQPAAAPTGPEETLAHLHAPALALSQPNGQGRELLLTPRMPRASLPRMPDRQPEEDRQLPAAYRLRVAPNRTALAKQLGATSESERAVEAALKWLAQNQEPEGRWNAARHEAGKELLVAGRNRQQAGLRADTGITGLALLAFLASGHTHQRGEYQSTVRRGLQYLMQSQAPDGSLGGEAATFAFMYCHGMAAFALSEALGMSGDHRLREPVRRAVAYTLAAQNPTTGGWRYSPGDPGDTSQLGWQVMALKSAELAGEPFPVRTRNGAIRFLNSVAYGRLGGLSSYRPGERVSRAMTAEALACRFFLGMARDHPASYEAADYLLGQLPGTGKPNFYYWYYATLVMYELQGEYWQRWNEALQRTLISTQRQTGPSAGSWDPDTVWGGYGGRVYSTALATLCLEVYYRFLPLYLGTAPAVAER